MSLLKTHLWYNCFEKLANATSNFLAAPQQLDPTDGTILGHALPAPSAKRH